MSNPNGMDTYQKLRGLTDTDLIGKLEHQLSLAPDTRQLLLVQYYRDELVRREQEKSTQAILGYTKQMKMMTVVILVATLLSLAIAVISFNTFAKKSVDDNDGSL